MWHEADPRPPEILMPRIVQALAAVLALGLSATAAPSFAAAPKAPVETQVMVLGVYHLGNPGQDLNNVRADDPTTPRRQAELQRIADALKRFRPTKIMVERLGVGPTLDVHSYAKFTPADLRKEPSEAVQIGYRLASQLGHTAVYGVDERGKEGGPDYFPWQPLADFSKARGDGRADALMATGKTDMARIEAAQARSIGDALLALNDPAHIRAEQMKGYYGVLSEGEGDRQPGADLNAGWYLRNAKIFAKISQASAPGDRVLVVFGAGHAWWLRHFASLTPGFALVEPTPYLLRAR